MSRIKEIKKNPETNMSLIDLLGLFCSEDKKSKYVETLYKSVKNKVLTQFDKDDWFKGLSKKYNISKGELIKIPFFQLIIFTQFLENFSLDEDIKQFQKFIEFNERGIVSNNDLSTYNSFDQINSAVSSAELKDIEKGLENQIIKIHESNEWLVLRPLTFHASKKYGSSTKWCTTTANQPRYFMDYAGNGVLIYVINKKNGLKVAVHNNSKELTFWNQIDTRIDSMQSGLPNDILKIIKDEIDNNPKSNLSFLSKEDRIKQELLSGKNFSSGVQQEQPTRRIIDLGNFDVEDNIEEGEEEIETLRNNITIEDIANIIDNMVDFNQEGNNLTVGNDDWSQMISDMINDNTESGDTE